MTTFRIMLPTGDIVTEFQNPTDDLFAAARSAECDGYDVVDVSEPDVVVVRSTI